METYTHLHMEAATCLWEAMIEADMTGWKADPENPQGDPSAAKLTGNAADMYRLWRDVGTVEMRHHAIGLADFMLKVWDAIPEDEQEDFVPYDWTFTPLFLSFIQWDTGVPVHLTDATEFANMLRAAKGLLAA
jgi:hypothetical protein